ARMERLHTAFERLRESGELLHGGDGHPGLGDARRGRTGRHEGDAGIVEPARELLQTGLVVHADERTADGSGGLHDSGASCSCGWILWSGHDAGVHPVTRRPSIVSVPFARKESSSTSRVRSRARMRSWSDDSSSSSRTAIGNCAMIGPVSTPASTRWNVVPVTLTPWAIASRTPCAPGKDGSRAGCVLMMRCAKR